MDLTWILFTQVKIHLLLTFSSPSIKADDVCVTLYRCGRRAYDGLDHIS